MEEIKKLNIQIGALNRSVNHLIAILERNERQESVLSLRKKELMIAKGKKTKLMNKLTKAA